MRSALSALALVWLSSCSAEVPERADAGPVGNSTVDEQFEPMEAMLESEALRFHSAEGVEVARSHVFEGEGDQPFAQTAARCLGHFYFGGSSHLVTATMPSENSAIYLNSSSNWSDEEAVECFRKTSQEDFFVIRAPNFLGVGGEPIMPHDE